MTNWETVIGLEVHCQLSTKTKIFCGCSTQFGAPPNQNTCPVCLGMPGVLPVLNEKVVEYAVRVGAALGCQVQTTSTFARKNYFYPDLPKGYQITQYDAPICEGGRIELDVGDATKTIRLTRIHLEEDAGKSVHLGAAATSHVDFNRAGTPLIEIVSEPELRSAEEASAYLKELRNIVRYLEVCDGHMEQGSFRCDANVSVRPVDTAAFGTRVELKNLNSFNHVKRAIDYEAERQIALLESGGTVVQETRLWDDARQLTRSMRSKEEAHDYRYFPEPDLPVLTLGPSLLENSRNQLPELPRQRRTRYETELALSRYDADVLISEKELSDFFEAVVATGVNPKIACNWVTVELRGRLNADGTGLHESPVSAADLGEILGRIAEGKLSGKLAKKVFTRVYDGESVQEVLAQIGEQVTDPKAIDALVEELIDANPEKAAAFRNGKQQLLGFFMGQAMKKSGGKVNPQALRETLARKLGE